MNVKPKGVVTLPRAMRKGLLILPWAKEVNRALQQLRDRIVTVPSSRPSSSGHPWKVTSNGDNTISVGYGSIYSYDEASITLREFKYFAGFTTEGYSAITVTGTGSIYGRIASLAATSADINYSGTDSNGDTYGMELNRVFPDATADVLFSFETTVPTSSSVFYFEIAKVEVTDSIASVTRQILVDNPVMASWIEAA